jgi:hypothetical protein
MVEGRGAEPGEKAVGVGDQEMWDIYARESRGSRFPVATV